MSPAPQSEPRYKTKAGAFFTPPALTPLFAGTPRATRQYWPLATKLEAEFLKLLTDPRWARQNPDLSWTVKSPPKAALARALDVCTRTIVRLYQSTRDKHFLHMDFDYYKGTRKVKARRVVIFSFRNALDRRKADPEIAQTSDRRVVYRGRGRRPMTPQQAQEWQIDLANVPAFDEDPIFGEDPMQDETPLAPPEPVAPAPVVEMPAPPPPAADLILEALDECVIPRGSTAKDAAACQRAAGPDVPPELIAEQIRTLAAAKRGSRNPGMHLSNRWFIDRIEAFGETWRRERNAERQRAQKLERERAANGGVCPTCRGIGRVEVLDRGGGSKPCPDCARTEQKRA